MTALLIGGQPKGYDEPFSIQTRSGKILRGMVDRLIPDPFERLQRVYYADIWANQEEEDAKKFDSESITELWWLADEYWPPVALGRYQYNFLRNQIRLPDIRYLPHPASRSQNKLKELFEGLEQAIFHPEAPFSIPKNNNKGRFTMRPKP